MQKNELIRVRITDINNLGCGVGHLENAAEDTGKTVFVRGGVTGDELDNCFIVLLETSCF